MKGITAVSEVKVSCDGVELPGTLAVPPRAIGVVLFAHGSGSSRHSRRNQQVATSLQARGIGTLLFDLLTEDEAADRENVFNILLLGRRMIGATHWMKRESAARDLPIAYFGASTGAAAALLAASVLGPMVKAVVSRGGRPDLAGDALPRVTTPTLLLVGSQDEQVLALNRTAALQIRGGAQLTVIQGATHLFEEPGALESVSSLAGEWLLGQFTKKHEEISGYRDRAEAGELLAPRVAAVVPRGALVLAIPRGGVEVGAPIAEAVDGELGLVLAHKIGAPDNPEAAIGAVGSDGEIRLDRERLHRFGFDESSIEASVREARAQLQLRAEIYGDYVLPPETMTRRHVIVTDDGLATGETMLAALHVINSADPASVTVAVPVGSQEAIRRVEPHCTRIICPMAPPRFRAVGHFYQSFGQVGVPEVLQQLQGAAGRT